MLQSGATDVELEEEAIMGIKPPPVTRIASSISTVAATSQPNLHRMAAQVWSGILGARESSLFF